MKQKFLVFVSVYFLLFIAFFPNNIGSFNLQRNVTLFLFEDVTKFLGQILFKEHFRTDFSSDSISMIILMIILAILSLLVALLLKKNRPEFIFFAQKLAIYYVAFILFKYGIDKLFNAQFYLPEPNILFTKFGDLDQDILFWSLMGTSRTYSVLLGSIEILVAIFLIFKRTRILGLLLAFFTLINILIVNFSFDISVKLFSITLFLMVIFALKDVWVKLYFFLILKISCDINSEEFALPQKLKPFLFPLKVLMIGFLFLQIFLPYLNTENWNDATAKRPFLHGAYEVINENNKKKNNLKYVFFHRMHYLIFMDKNDKTTDALYEIDTIKHQITSRKGNENPFSFKYENLEKDSLLLLKKEAETLKLKKKNWQKMPALKPNFHWYVEEY